MVALDFDINPESDLDLDVELFDIDDESASGRPIDLDSVAVVHSELEEVEGFEYPSMFLSNIYFLDCVRVLKSIKREGSHREYPVWLKSPDNGEFICIGNIQLDSSFLLALRYLGCGLTLYVEPGAIMDVQLTAEEIERYI